MLHKETVDASTLELLKQLMADKRLEGFVLVGGTALSLQMGHRVSVDLDLFVNRDFEAEELREYLERTYHLQTDYLAFATVKGEIDGVQVDCIAHSYPWIGPFVEEDGIRLASMEDICAMKLNAIAGNGTRIKDFIDQEIEYGPHEKQAQEEAAQPPVVKTKFSDYIVQWRRIFKTGKAATYEVFMDAKQSVLLKWFGDKYIEDITPTDVQDFLSHRAKTYKKATVKADWAMLKEVLDSAVSDDLIVKNPAKDKRVHNPAKAGEGTAPLTREQIASIQKAIPELEDSRERCLIALLAYTSMRREEVLGLMWENINFETRMIEIKQAVVHPVNVAVTKETKNEFSVRPFPMCDQLYNILLGCRKQRGYVISKEDGSPVSQVTYRRLWDSLKSHIELYGMTAINFRTTFATMMVASGVDIKTTQALMGHSTPEMTLKVYAKKEESRLPDAVRKMETFLAGSAAF